MTTFRTPVLLTWLLLTMTAAFAQEACPALLTGAAQTTQVVCATVEADHVCYGSGTVTISPTSDQVAFNEPGNRAAVSAVANLSTTSDDSYGMALIRSHAYVPDSWDSQEITLLAFGEVTLENRGQENVSLPTLDAQVTANAGANVRLRPSTDSPIIAQLVVGKSTKITGRLADTSWLRVALPQGGAGWVVADAVTSTGELTLLSEVSTDDPAPDKLTKPMQAFSFQTAIDDAPCAEAPDSGIIVQSPDSVGEVELFINDVAIRLQGTLHLQSQPDEQFALNVIEGAARILVNDSWLAIEAGLGIVLPPIEDDILPEPYDYARLYSLPTQLLPRPILIAVRSETFIKPAISNVDPLANLTPNDTCTIAPVNDINLRAGPGQNYRLRLGGMKPGESAQPDGRATGSDGRVWWRLTYAVWVSSDVVFARGACFALPEVGVPAP